MVEIKTHYKKYLGIKHRPDVVKLCRRLNSFQKLTFPDLIYPIIARYHDNHCNHPLLTCFLSDEQTATKD